MPYKKGAPVVFPDFALTYLGERRKAAPPYPRDFIYQDFRVSAAQGEQIVSWSAGTGAIGPALFNVGKKKFALELSWSDKLGRLSKGELVMTQMP